MFFSRKDKQDDFNHLEIIVVLKSPNKQDLKKINYLTNPLVYCLTVKNWWGLLTGDDWLGLGESNIYHQLVDLNRKIVIK